MRRVVQALNESLHQMMAADENILVLGEDLLDPYGGAFKVTKGLSEAFGDRVIGTPISEPALVGVATGLALQGFKPVVEIMFGDFVTLIADQIINHVSKISSMYGHPVPLPLMVRTPMGGRRGYGPTHSQTLDKLFFGVPGLTVVAVSHAVDPGQLLAACLTRINGPVLFIENKVLYPLAVLDHTKSGFTQRVEESTLGIPTLTLSQDDQPDVTLVTYGGMLPLVMEAAEHLRQVEELSCEIVAPHQISPCPMNAVRRSVMKTRRVVTVEEGIGNWGWGSEIIARLADIRLEAPAVRVSGQEAVIPACRALEDRVLPQAADIIDGVIRTVDQYYL